jgi:hypothetical protein
MSFSANARRWGVPVPCSPAAALIYAGTRISDLAQALVDCCIAAGRHGRRQLGVTFSPSRAPYQVCFLVSSYLTSRRMATEPHRQRPPEWSIARHRGVLSLKSATSPRRLSLTITAICAVVTFVTMPVHYRVTCASAASLWSPIGGRIY